MPIADAAPDDRPDPDALLERVRSEEARAHRGKLKVFFGASPGVGKTYAMLLGARRLREQGVDVVIGLVETHGRAETAQLVAGIERLPTRVVEHRDRTLAEFDLDAALARKPAVLLVDELAHTNAPGSRHPKRWQDVEELLDAGIEVHTTLNVQHIESLNDIVGSITGVRVWETVPDTLFDAANEVVLVDLPADDLLQRLKEGKVYVPDQAERAVRNFFRKGNLLALRELALRRTAERVDDEMRSYRREYVGGGVWQAEEAVLACVGPNPGAEKVVRTAARLANALDSRWHALYVETPALARLPQERRTAILRSLALAEDLGATTATVAAEDAAAATIEYARKHNLGKLVIGRRTGRPRWPFGPVPFIQQVAQAPDLDVLGVANERAAAGPARRDEAARDPAVALTPYGWALAVTAALTGLSALLFPYLHQTNIVMVFLLGVVGTSMRWGRGPAIANVIASVLCFDFFFVPPYFSFAVSDLQYVVTFAVMLVVGLVIAQLMTRLRYQARIANYREERAANLYELARALSGALTVDQVGETARRVIRESFRADSQILVLHDDDNLAPIGASDVTFDPGIARIAFERDEPAGIGTDTLPAAAQFYMPLRAPMRTRGVLVVEPENGRLLRIPEQRRLLETFAALIAIALERVHYVSVAQSTIVGMETERLRNSLLAALSHDLRTPITALVGLSETLAMQLPDERQRRDALAIRDHAERMAKLVDNLLEMARLQGGSVRLKRDWQSMEELVGAALDELGTTLAGRAVATELPPGLPLVRCDGVLIERVLVNLVENALKYTPATGHIAIGARIEGGRMHVTVRDDGPGIPRGQEKAIFEKFQRGNAESTIPGVGLGLAIARTIVEAHGGTIAAEAIPEGGVAFTFTLPLEPAPALQGDGAAEPTGSAVEAGPPGTIASTRAGGAGNAVP